MIRLEDVYLSLAGKEVLGGIDLEVAPGERLVIMGESGVGNRITSYNVCYTKLLRYREPVVKRRF